MTRTLSMPRGPPAPIGTFDRFRAEIVDEKASKVAAAASRLTAQPVYLGTNPRPGQYWQVMKDGKECPIVVCDEDLIINPEFLNQKHRPISAALPDGTWHKRYRPHFDSEGYRRIPGLFLETLEFDWLVRYRLSRLRPGAARAMIKAIDGMGDVASQSALRDAYASVVQEDDLAYWKSAVLAKRLSGEATAGDLDVRQSRSDEDLSKSNGVSKRKLGDEYCGFSQGAGYPHAIETDDCMDDDEGHLFLDDPNVKQERRSGSLLGVPDQDTRGTGAKRQKVSVSAQGLTVSTSSKDMPAQKISDDQVRIFVGNPHHQFTVTKAGLKESALLQSLIKTENGEAYIMSPLLSSIDPLNFQRVAEYLTYGDYTPNILNAGTAHARLETIDPHHDPSAMMTQCGLLFRLGTDLDLPGLQDLSVTKFLVLASFASYADFLSTVRLFYRRGRPANAAFHAFVVGYLAENFMAVWEEQARLFHAFLAKHGGLKVDVMTKIVEWEGEGKGEGKGEGGEGAEEAVGEGEE